jgi:16S rRNA processing protein RimM
MDVVWDDMVTVGTIARPHGLRGHVLIQPLTDFPEDRFRAGATVFAAGAGAPDRSPRAHRIREARWHLGRLLVAFDDVQAIEEAEALGGSELRVPAEWLMPLPPGHFYHHDLLGCEVVTVGGEALGRVTGVSEAGGATLTVQGRRGEVLIPLAEEICVAIDVAARRILVAPPEGLLEVNA